MKEIKGITIPVLGFIPQKIGDLIYHEGPLLSLFIDRNNPDIYYLYKWADCDDRTNRWLVTQINTLSLRSFFYKETSLRSVLIANPLTYVLGLNDNLTEVEIIVSATSDLPEDYLPRENSFYSEEKYTEFSRIFKNIVSNSRIYDVLNEILKEINTLKRNQSNTQKLLTILLNPDRNRSNPDQESILYGKQTSIYEPQMLN